MAKQKRKTDSVAEPQSPEIGKGYHLPAGRYAEKLKRERRAKKIATIVMGASLAGVALMSVIAFLGKVSGNFTIQVAKQNVGASLYLYHDRSFGEPTTRLLAGGDSKTRSPPRATSSSPKPRNSANRWKAEIPPCWTPRW